MKIQGTSLIAITSALCLSSSAMAESPEKNIVETAVAAGQFETLAAALGAADLVETLQGDGPFTVFAPTDEAFAKLPEGTVENLLKPENLDQLKDILTYHVVAGDVSFAAAAGLDGADALNGQRLPISVTGGRIMIGEATVIENDVATSNGTIHIIDTVLLPPADDQANAGHSPMGVARAAIEKGVPLFNAGHHNACADIYHDAAISLMEMPERQLDQQARQAIGLALEQNAHTHCATTHAWNLRMVLDHVVAAN